MGKQFVKLIIITFLLICVWFTYAYFDNTRSVHFKFGRNTALPNNVVRTMESDLNTRNEMFTTKTINTLTTNAVLSNSAVQAMGSNLNIGNGTLTNLKITGILDAKTINEPTINTPTINTPVLNNTVFNGTNTFSGPMATDYNPNGNTPSFRIGQMNFLYGAKARSYNPIVEAEDSVIFTDRADLDIVPRISTAGGIKIKKDGTVNVASTLNVNGVSGVVKKLPGVSATGPNVPRSVATITSTEAECVAQCSMSPLAMAAMYNPAAIAAVSGSPAVAARTCRCKIGHEVDLSPGYNTTLFF